MLNTISLSQIFVLDQDEALDFYVGTLGLEVKIDQDLGFMRWLTVGLPGEPGREILLETPGPPAMDDATAQQVRELVTKGATGGWIGFQTDDVKQTYEERDYGTDCGLRDPFGNAIRIVQPPSPS